MRLRTQSARLLSAVAMCLLLAHAAQALVVRFQGRNIRLDEYTVEERVYLVADDLSEAFLCDMSLEPTTLRVVLTAKDGKTVEFVVGSDVYRIGSAEFVATETPIVDSEGNVLLPLSVAMRKIFPYFDAVVLRKRVEELPPGAVPTPTLPIAVLAETPSPEIPGIELPQPGAVVPTLDEQMAPPELRPPWGVENTPTAGDDRRAHPTEIPAGEKEHTGTATWATDTPPHSPLVFATPTLTPTVREAPADRSYIRGIDTVVIDIGPTVSQRGAIGAYNVVEYNVCKEIALALEAAVTRTLGLKVVYTIPPDADSSGRLSQRLGQSYGVQRGILVSLHAGAAVDPEFSGFAVYYMSPTYESGWGANDTAQQSTTDTGAWSMTYLRHVGASRALAHALFESLSTGSPLRPLSARAGRLALFRGLDMPGALVEVGTLTATADADYLRRREVQRDVGNRLAEGIAKFLQLERAGMAADERAEQ